jgi:hypothetical protein
MARGRALDLFTYHGWFAVHMASRADSVLAVDTSVPALEAGAANATLNGFTRSSGPKPTGSTFCDLSNHPETSSTLSSSTRRHSPSVVRPWDGPSPGIRRSTFGRCVCWHRGGCC